MVRRFYTFFIKNYIIMVSITKNNEFSHFLKSFYVLDIYKCPKSVFESKIQKKVLFYLPSQTAHLVDEYLMFITGLCIIKMRKLLSYFHTIHLSVLVFLSNYVLQLHFLLRLNVTFLYVFFNYLVELFFRSQIEQSKMSKNAPKKIW